MRRRQFLGVLGAAATWPVAARAQQAERVRRIGMLLGFPDTDPESPARIELFRKTLDRLGWKEGRNVHIDYRWAGAERNRLQMHAKDLIRAMPDVVVAETSPATAALKQESRTTPIVFINAGNPIGSGFVASFTHPGGNLTGFTNYVPSMGGKWMELLKELAPGLTRTAALFNPRTHTGQYWDVLDAAGRSFNVTFAKAAVEDAAAIGPAIEAMASEPGGGLLVMPDAFTMNHRETIVALTARHRVPAIYPYRVFPDSGGLISYGMSRIDVYRDAASYVDRILRGERPADLPVQAPTKLELVINLMTAKALGLEVPPTLLAIADEVIE